MIEKHGGSEAIEDRILEEGSWSFGRRWYNSILICFSSTNISGKGGAGVEIFKRKHLIYGNDLRWQSK